MVQTYFPVVVALVIGVLFSLLFVVLSKYFGPHRPSPTKNSVYECGMAPIGGTQQRFSVKFFLVAVLFLLFDLEAVFLYPWAVTYKGLVEAGGAVIAFWEMFAFLAVLLVGWWYCLQRGALEWD
jgi:NADH-quinone oxidoreductase subunit A